VSGVSFPFRLVVLTEEGGQPRPVTLSGRAVAFSASESAAAVASAFMAARGAGRWEFLLVGRSMVPPLVDRLKGWGVCGLVLDPAEDAPGVTVGFEALGPAAG
jgi:hypothetical protein